MMAVPGCSTGGLVAGQLATCPVERSAPGVVDLRFRPHSFPAWTLGPSFFQIRMIPTRARRADVAECSGPITKTASPAGRTSFRRTTPVLRRVSRPASHSFEHQKPSRSALPRLQSLSEISTMTGIRIW